MQSLVIILASLGVLVASQGFGGGFGGRGGVGGGGFGGPGGNNGGFPGFPGGQGGRGGHGGHPFGPPPPPFLENVTQEGRAAFFQLFQDPNQTKADIKTAVDAWAATYGVSDAVAQFDAEMKAKQTERRSNVTTAVGQLADALSKVQLIEDAQDLSIAATREQIHEALEAMSPELRDLVLAVSGPPRPPRITPGGGMGGGIGGGFPGGQIGGGMGGGFPGFPTQGEMGGGFPGGQMGGQNGFGSQLDGQQGGRGGRFPGGF